MEERHWFDELVERIEEALKERYARKGIITINGGLSVSGLQHIGRLRGEILLGEALRRELEKRGYRVRQLLTLYTVDPWKGKEGQRRQFPDPEEARRYVGWPLEDVPDPKGCHRNWIDHFWSDFGPYIGEFTDGRIEIVTTGDLYRGPFRKLILEEVLPKRELVRDVINKYRGRKPYPEDWIPVEPRCGSCGRIDSTKALSVRDDGRVEYVCKYCGYKGVADVSESKLNWRIEWAGVWKVLSVDFEPYGKDHATPGGSRDSCVEISRVVFDYEPPLGEWYEWVGLRVGGKETDMSSSGFTGITPREWLEVAHPQILRFLYFLVPPRRKIVVDPGQIPQYYEQYYRAERIYFGVEDGEDDAYLKRTYELSHPGKIPDRLPAQVPYTHAAILAQLVPREKVDEALARLRRTGHLPMDADEYSIEWIKGLLEKARRWVELYAPSSLRVKILDKLDEAVAASLKYKAIFSRLADRLETLEEWREDKIKEAMIEATTGLSGRERREFYREFYRVFVGEDRGPRAAPLLSLLPKEFVLERLREAAGLSD
ncbi:MAG: lysine--tRNA ligase [Desulfurococcales archaeon]|nr:lysine--tRNA ligase [Desulfurococcales archaeon]